MSRNKSAGKAHPVPDPSVLLERLGVQVDPETLRLALTHRSYAYENGGVPTNERLEFLGDAVLGVVVTEALYRGRPDVSEGQLAKQRAAVVNMHALAHVARAIGLGDFVLLGRGEEATGGRNKSSILADTTEAVIGATFLSAGPEAAAGLVHRLVDPLLAESELLGAGLDWKTSLQELTAGADLGVPEYLIRDEGPDHAKRYFADAVVSGDIVGRGEGTSKKDAEQRAAEQAWNHLVTTNDRAQAVARTAHLAESRAIHLDD